MKIKRFNENPLITPETDGVSWSNINGPSVVEVPDWVSDPLGKYYLYFASHDGDSIRVAYADQPCGPWTVADELPLQKSQTQFHGHIASPDVHVDDQNECLLMYFHGGYGMYFPKGINQPRIVKNGIKAGGFISPSRTNMLTRRLSQHFDFDYYSQVTNVATSMDGLSYNVIKKSIGEAYFCVWDYKNSYYALANDGYLYSSESMTTVFERRHILFEKNRHFAVRKSDEETLQIFFSRRGDRPERLMVTEIDLSCPVNSWQINPKPPETVLRPEYTYEGADLPVKTSKNGAAWDRVHAVRDPEIFETNDRTYLFYTIAGEAGIAGAELFSVDSIY